MEEGTSGGPLCQEEGWEVGGNVSVVLSHTGHALLPRGSLNGAVSSEQADHSRPGKTY